VIIGFEQLAEHRGQVAMVDGCFDPLHRGHLKYFAEARALGVPVLCNIAPDAYVAGKHPPFLPEEHRATLIDALRDIDLTHLNRGRTTADVLRELRPRYYVKGSDWRDRLPSQETALCRELGIEIAYVEVTPDASRTILGEFARRRTTALENQTAEFEAVLRGQGGSREPAAVDASDSTMQLLDAVTALLQPESIYWLTPRSPANELLWVVESASITVGDLGMDDAAALLPPPRFELVLGDWGDAPVPMTSLTRIIRHAGALASRFVCISAAFHPSPEHLLSLVAGKSTGSGSEVRPSRELLRVLLALEGFQSRRELEARLESESGLYVLVMERSGEVASSG